MFAKSFSCSLYHVKFLLAFMMLVFMFYTFIYYIFFEKFLFECVKESSIENIFCINSNCIYTNTSKVRISLFIFNSSVFMVDAINLDSYFMFWKIEIKKVRTTTYHKIWLLINDGELFF